MKKLYVEKKRIDGKRNAIKISLVFIALLFCIVPSFASTKVYTIAGTNANNNYWTSKQLVMNFSQAGIPMTLNGDTQWYYTYGGHDDTSGTFKIQCAGHDIVTGGIVTYNDTQSGNYIPFHYELTFDDNFDDHGLTGRHTDCFINLTSGTAYHGYDGTYPYATSPYAIIRSGSSAFGGTWTYTYIDPLVDEMLVNFTGYPLDGYSPLSVDFRITNYSAANESGFTWSWGDGQVTESTENPINHVYQNPGIYSVTLSYYDQLGNFSSVYKQNYVLASNASGLIVNLDVKHAITGALIQDSTVGIQNTSTGVWRNVTAPTGLVYFSSTDPGYLYPLTQGQSITLAANKSGFSDASSTFNIPYNNYLVQLFLMPNTVVNSTGNGTVVINTIANKDGHSIPGISVSLDSGQMGITNSAGAVTLFNVSAGTRYAQIVDSQERFQDTSTSFDLSAGETKLVVVQMVYEGDDPVETPVSPTPTPTGTYDPDDPNSPVYGNYTTSEINQQGGAGVLGMLAQLIALWPAIVIFAFLKFMRSAMT